MKKCPYCKTLNDDEQETCVNCLHDITEVSVMAPPLSKKFSVQITIMIFGLIMLVGGIAAFFSQRDVYYNYLDLMKIPDLTSQQVAKFQELANQASFEMTAMLIVSIVGVVTFIAGAVFLAIKYFKQQSK